jgi:hypothetical protein
MPVGSFGRRQRPLLAAQPDATGLRECIFLCLSWSSLSIALEELSSPSGRFILSRLLIVSARPEKDRLMNV